MLDVAIIGGGAAGFFAAINIKEKHPGWKVSIYEKSQQCLGKVKISGGGRCNVTHNCFDPKVLSTFYPRGSRELLSVFSRFNPRDTINWFASKGVKIKAESDGRMFPVSDDSQTIIDCFYEACKRLQIDIHLKSGISDIRPTEKGFDLLVGDKTVQCRKLVVASGSSEFFWQRLAALGHAIVRPVPSLFTFNVRHPAIEGLMGLSVPKVQVRLVSDKTTLKSEGIKDSDLQQEGPLLITHWGLSGPAILKLSSIAARWLNRVDYKFDIRLNFVSANQEQTLQKLLQYKELHLKKQMDNTPLFELPSRLWQRLLSLSSDKTEMTWADSSKKELNKLAGMLCALQLKVNGKSTFKEEFVTAGGVALNEVDFRTLESKKVPGLYLAGEVLNIDALTGGFNFQAAWSEAWIISESL